MRCALGIVLTLGLACAADAQTLDQYSPYTNTSFNMSASVLDWQQEVVVGLAGPLVRVELYVNGPGSCTFYINKGSPWQGDVADFTTTFSSAGTGWVPLDTSAAGLSFNPGDHFVLGFIGTDSGLGLTGSGETAPNGGYVPGRLYLNGANYANGSYDIAFKTYVVVPAPGAVAIVGLGLVPGLTRRRGCGAVGGCPA